MPRGDAMIFGVTRLAISLANEMCDFNWPGWHCTNGGQAYVQHLKAVNTVGTHSHATC